MTSDKERVREKTNDECRITNTEIRRKKNKDQELNHESTHRPCSGQAKARKHERRSLSCRPRRKERKTLSHYLDRIDRVYTDKCAQEAARAGSQCSKHGEGWGQEVKKRASVFQSRFGTHLKLSRETRFSRFCGK